MTRPSPLVTSGARSGEDPGRAQRRHGPEREAPARANLVGTRARPRGDVVHAGIALPLVGAALALLVPAGRTAWRPTSDPSEQPVLDLLDVLLLVFVGVEPSFAVGRRWWSGDRLAGIAVLAVLVLLLGATSGRCAAGAGVRRGEVAARVHPGGLPRPAGRRPFLAGSGRLTV